MRRQDPWRCGSIAPAPAHHLNGYLSAYDDLIENNLRRIKILEAMAQNLYREWFVKFRFPGHEQARFVDSPLGRIPDGWEVKGVGEVAYNFDRLRRPLSSIQRAERKGIYPYYGAAKIFDYIDAYIFDGIYLLVAEDGSVVTPDRKPVLQYVSGRFWPNNHTHILQGKGSVSTEFLYMVLSEIDISGYVTGAAQPKITQANLNRIPVLVAEDRVLAAFNEFIGDVFRQRIVVGEKNEALRRTRDLLLPRLISGEVDVSGLDIAVPEEAEA
jgi:type I restriction enzyme S subunit